MNEQELVKWINYLISVNKLEYFYHSKWWKSLKKEVLREQHYECQLCLENGLLTILNDSSPVHHVNEVKNVPSLALSKFFIDENGKKKRQLISLCFECHNKIHNRFCVKEKFMNEEKW